VIPILFPAPAALPAQLHEHRICHDLPGTAVAWIAIVTKGERMIRPQPEASGVQRALPIPRGRTLLSTAQVAARVTGR